MEFLGKGGILKAKFLEAVYENKPEFPGGRGVRNKKPSVGGVWISSGTAHSHSMIWSFIRAVHISPVYTDIQTGHEKVVEGHAWVGKVIFSCKTSQDSLFLIVKSKVRKSGTFN